MSSGRELRESILGREHVEATAARPLKASSELVELAEDFVWSKMWQRPGVVRRDKSLITICTLAALRQDRELRLHVAGAMRLGLLTEEEIGGALLHQLPYIGFPAAAQALEGLRSVVESNG